MSVSKTFLFVSLATVLATGSLLAQGASTTGSRGSTEGRVEHFDASGVHHVRKVTPEGHEALMRDARPLPAGSMIYRSGGNLYVIQDRKLPNGKMMSEQTEWFNQAEGNID